MKTELDDIAVGRIPLLPLSVAKGILEAEDVSVAVRDTLIGHPVSLSAVSVASASLADVVEAWLKDERDISPSALARIAAYLIRACYRSTPFGMFATVGTTRFGESNSHLTFVADARYVKTSVDTEALYLWLEEREADPSCLSGFIFERNPLIANFGAYLCTQEPSVLRSGFDGQPRRQMIRLRPKLQKLLSLIPTRATYERLLGLIRSEHFEQVEAEQLITKLVKAAILVPRTRPSLRQEPFRELLEQFREVPRYASQLSHIDQALCSYDKTPFNSRSLYDTKQLSSKVQNAISRSRSALYVTSYHHFTGSLPETLLGDIERLGRVHGSAYSLVDQSALVQALMLRYEGHDRLIPLIDLIGPKKTIDTTQLVPSWKVGEAQAIAGRKIVDRAFECLALGNQDVLLSDGEVTEFLKAVPPPSNLQFAEFGFQISAADYDSLNDGNYRLIAASFPAVAGLRRSAGRFADLQLGSRMEDSEDSQKTSFGDDVELLMAPLAIPQAANLSTSYRRRNIPVLDLTGVSNEPNALDLRKVFIGINNDQPFLYSQELGRIIRLCLSTMVDGLRVLPPHLRFIAGFAEPVRMQSIFQFRTLEAMPFLPRISWGRIVLRRARLRFESAQLFSSAMPDAVLLEALSRWRFPKWVLLNTDGDSKLPLNLSHKFGRQILVDQVRRSKAAIFELEELLPTLDDRWFRSSDGNPHCAEFIISIRYHTDAGSMLRQKGIGHAAALPVFDKRLAEDWRYVKLYLPAIFQNEFLSGHVAPFTRNLLARGLSDKWFFVRYHDTGPHIRIRILCAAGARKMVSDELMTFCEDLVSSDLIEKWQWDIYEPEYERYGGLKAISEWHDIFQESSHEAIAATAGLFGSHLSVNTLLPLGKWLLDLLGQDARDFIRIVRPVPRKLSDVDYELQRDLAARLRLMFGDYDGGRLTAIDNILRLNQAGVLTRPLCEILPSIIHMHFNRNGIAGADEARGTEILYRSLWTVLVRLAADK